MLFRLSQPNPMHAWNFPEGESGGGGGGGEDAAAAKAAADSKTSEWKPPASQEDFEAQVLERVRRAERAAKKASEPDRKALEEEIRAQIERDRAAEKAKEQGEYQKLYEGSTTEIETLKAKIAELETASVARELAALRSKVGAKHGLPESLIDRLIGEDEAAIEADAKKVAAELKIEAPNTEAGKGGGAKKPVDSNRPKTPDTQHRFNRRGAVVPFPGREAAKQEA